MSNEEENLSELNVSKEEELEDVSEKKIDLNILFPGLP